MFVSQTHTQEAISTTLTLYLRDHCNFERTQVQKFGTEQLLVCRFPRFPVSPPSPPQHHALRMGLPVAMVSTRWVVMARPLVAKIARMVFIASTETSTKDGVSGRGKRETTRWRCTRSSQLKSRSAVRVRDNSEDDDHLHHIIYIYKLYI